jgi:hypothetical protein
VEHELAAALGLAQEIGNSPQLWKMYAALVELRGRRLGLR